MTIFADDVEGRRYDLRIPCKFENFFKGVWVCKLTPADFENTMYGSLLFNPDGRVALHKMSNYHNPGSESLERYEGFFRISIAEGEEYRPGTILFDLYLDWWIWDGGGEIDNPREIRGVYLTEIDSSGNLNLWLSEGEALHRILGTPVNEYFFWQDIG